MTLTAAIHLMHRDTCGSCSDVKIDESDLRRLLPTGVPQADYGLQRKMFCRNKCRRRRKERVIADVNGDSKDDVLVASFADDTVAWYKRMADGTFQKNNLQPIVMVLSKL